MHSSCEFPSVRVMARCCSVGCRDLMSGRTWRGSLRMSRRRWGMYLTLHKLAAICAGQRHTHSTRPCYDTYTLQHPEHLLLSLTVITGSRTLRPATVTTAHDLPYSAVAQLHSCTSDHTARSLFSVKSSYCSFLPFSEVLILLVPAFLLHIRCLSIVSY
jgi:hypothetical protein